MECTLCTEEIGNRWWWKTREQLSLNPNEVRKHVVEGDQQLSLSKKVSEHEIFELVSSQRGRKFPVLGNSNQDCDHGTQVAEVDKGRK